MKDWTDETANVDVRPAYRKLYLCLYAPESRQRLVHCLYQRDYFTRYVRISFNYITRKWRTNTAARTVPIKTAPNVFPRSKCGSVEEEDIVDAHSNSVSNAVVPPYYISHIPWVISAFSSDRCDRSSINDHRCSYLLYASASSGVTPHSFSLVSRLSSGFRHYQAVQMQRVEVINVGEESQVRIMLMHR